MCAAPTVSIHEDRNVPGGGYAVIRVAGATTAPDDPGFAIRRQGYQKNNLGYNGWQGPEVRLQPIDVVSSPGQLDLMIGPEVVDVVEVGTPVELEIPALGLRTVLHWPDITPSVRAHQGPLRGRVGFGARPAAPERGPSPAPPPPPPGATGDDEPTAFGPAGDEPTLYGPRGNDGTILPVEWNDEADDRTVIGPPPLRPSEPPPRRAFEDDETFIGGLAPPPGYDEPEGDFLSPGSPTREPIEDDRPYRNDEDEYRPPPRRQGRRGWLAALLLVVVLLVVGGLGASIVFFPEIWPDGWFVAAPEEEPVVEPPRDGPAIPEPPPDRAETPPPLPPAAQPPSETRPPPQPVDLARPAPRDPLQRPVDFVRNMLRGNPAVEQTHELAQFYLDQGDVGVALLLLEYGADNGHGPSLRAIGRMYDPVHFSPGQSAFSHANPSRAADYYRRAREAGDPEARRALDELRAWAEAAAADGDPDAQRLLNEL